ncbi:general secretion pathway protein GspM [Asaia spathodeae]|uniref:type II secretion system protein GspM n=1 Tax=Asaia spathodeae TaxID=657016 RepID=UPI002FC2FD34
MKASSSSLPEGRRGQILACALLVIALFLVWSVALGPVFGLYAARAHRIAVAEETLERMRHLQEILPHLRLTAARLPQEGSRLIEGSSDAIAGANLQDLVQKIASTQGADLGSSETLPPVRDGHYRRIGLHITLTAPYAVLVHVLTSFETSTSAMVSDALHLHEAESEGAAPDSMSCDMNVLAYRRDTGAQKGSAP